GDALAIGEHERWSTPDAVLASEGQVALKYRRVAASRSARRLDRVQHPCTPGQCLVLRAPNIARLLPRVCPEHRIEERIHRHVAHRQHVALEAPAVATVRVGKDHQLAYARPLLPDD